ncbi:MAG: hypothetical protein ABI921_14655 [Panacibacter sp.]
MQAIINNFYRICMLKWIFTVSMFIFLAFTTYAQNTSIDSLVTNKLSSILAVSQYNQKVRLDFSIKEKLIIKDQRVPRCVIIPSTENNDSTRTFLIASIIKDTLQKPCIVTFTEYGDTIQVKKESLDKSLSIIFKIGKNKLVSSVEIFKYGKLIHSEYAKTNARYNHRQIPAISFLYQTFEKNDTVKTNTDLYEKFFLIDILNYDAPTLNQKWFSRQDNFMYVGTYISLCFFIPDCKTNQEDFTRQAIEIEFEKYMMDE